MQAHRQTIDLSFPRRREPSDLRREPYVFDERHWVPACAGTTTGFDERHWVATGEGTTTDFDERRWVSACAGTTTLSCLFAAFARTGNQR